MLKMNKLANYIKRLSQTLHKKVVNSNFWYNAYYKHTYKHKKELALIRANTLSFRRSYIKRFQPKYTVGDYGTYGLQKCKIIEIDEHGQLIAALEDRGGCIINSSGFTRTGFKKHETKNSTN